MDQDTINQIAEANQVIQRAIDQIVKLENEITRLKVTNLALRQENRELNKELDEIREPFRNEDYCN